MDSTPDDASLSQSVRASYEPLKATALKPLWERLGVDKAWQ